MTNARQVLARAGDRLFDRLRHRRAFALSESTAINGDFSPLRGHTYAVLVTFRRSGEPVPSPVWFALDQNGLLYVKTADGVGKVKRLRGDRRVLVAPSTMRGKPTGQAIKGTGRVLGPDDGTHAEKALAAAYGASRRASEWLLGGPGPAVYIEISPRT